MICSPLALIPKKDKGDYRLIHDLSFPKHHSVNSSIDRQFTAVQYDTIDTVVDKVKLCGRNCLMSKTDIENAFRLIPIHPADRYLLGFSWEIEGKKVYFKDACLAMGLSLSCQLFTRFSNALQWIMEFHYNAHMSHILDDFFFVGPAGTMTCQQNLQNFLKMCAHINIPIKTSKTMGPTTRIVIYGIEVDSHYMTTRLPDDKVVKICSHLNEVKHKEKVTLKHLQSLLGLLNFATSCIVPGRAFFTPTL